MNEPERFELFNLGPNQRKYVFILFLVSNYFSRVTYQKDTKIQNAASFTLQKEDHTLGNVLRM